MARKCGSGKKVAHRSSVSGRFITKGRAKASPRTTERECIRTGKKR